MGLESENKESALQRGFSKGLQPIMLSTSTHVFSEIYIHLNWHCKDDRPSITPRLKDPLYLDLEEYCNKSKGIKFFGVGGTDDHVHLLIQMEPHVCLAEWVGKIKGSSSHELNRQAGLMALEWQRGYGAVSFARRDLPAVQKYVANQAQHHQKGTANKILENFGQYMEIVQEEEPEYSSNPFELVDD